MLTTTEVKAHLRVEITDDDTLIDNLTAAAYAYAEKYTDSIILDAEKVDYLNDFSDEITLKHNNVRSITSITYYDQDDAQQSQTDYFLYHRGLIPILHPTYENVWPATNKDYENVVITYQAGYTTIPKPIDQAVLMLIGSMYEQRENHIAGSTISKVPTSAELLLENYKVVQV